MALSAGCSKSTNSGEYINPSLVKTLMYAESKEAYIIYMEYAGDNSNYLTKRIYTDRKPVKDE